MPRIPGVDRLRLGFQRAVGKDRVINPTTHDTKSSRSSQRRGIFLSIQRHQRKPFADAANKQHGLCTADAMFPRHAGQRGEYLGQTVCAAAACRFVKSDEQRKTGLVVNMVSIKHRHQDRSIEKPFHSRSPRLARSRSSRIFRSISSVAEAAIGWPARNTQTPCSCVSGPLPRTGLRVISSPALSNSRSSPGSRRNSSRSGLGMTIRPALSMVRRTCTMA